MKTFLKKFLYFLVVLAVAFLFFLLVWKVIYPSVSGALSRGGAYQAVLLDDGTFYFSKVANVNSAFVYLSDVFYLQTVKGQNPALVEFGTAGTLEAPYAPENHLQINRDVIRSIQDLKSDSPVIKAIRSYRDSQ